MDNEKMVMLTDDDMEMVTGGKNISKKASSLVMKDSSKKAANTLQTGAKKKAGDLVDREEKTSIDGKLILGDFPGPGTMC